MRIQKDILSVLAYHDIFNYPLTSEEITRFLTVKASDQQVKLNLKKLNSSIKAKKNYFYLKNHSKLVNTRLNRKKYSSLKLKKANLYKKILSYIPTINLIAITGALALDNSTKSDDIDLLIITAKDTIWTTRFFANLLLWPYKRSPNNVFQSNKACLNIFIDESHLKISDKNLYTAHEIAQMRVIHDKKNTYKKFIKANKWIYNYLPNWKPNQLWEIEAINKRSKTHSTDIPFKPFYFLESIFKHAQLKYMKSKITTEQIGDYQLFFHPKSTQFTVLNKYTQKLKKLRLDKQP